MRTLWGARVRTHEGASSPELVRASLSPSQGQVKGQLTSDMW